MISEEHCRREVVDLHRFFQDWFNGDLPQEDGTFARFERALAPAFAMITPDGRTHDRATILGAVRDGYGRGGYRIEIRNHRFLATFGDVGLVTYEEWQTTDAGERGRVSTALLRSEGAGSKGVTWLHVHETWLPTDQSKVAARPLQSQRPGHPGSRARDTPVAQPGERK